MFEIDLDHPTMLLRPVDGMLTQTAQTLSFPYHGPETLKTWKRQAYVYKSD